MSEPSVPVSALRALLQQLQLTADDWKPSRTLDGVIHELAALCDAAEPPPRTPAPPRPPGRDDGRRG